MPAAHPQTTRANRPAAALHAEPQPSLPTMGQTTTTLKSPAHQTARRATQRKGTLPRSQRVASPVKMRAPQRKRSGVMRKLKEDIIPLVGGSLGLIGIAWVIWGVTGAAIVIGAMVFAMLPIKH